MTIVVELQLTNLCFKFCVTQRRCTAADHASKNNYFIKFTLHTLTSFPSWIAKAQYTTDGRTIGTQCYIMHPTGGPHNWHIKFLYVQNYYLRLRRCLCTSRVYSSQKQTRSYKQQHKVNCVAFQYMCARRSSHRSKKRFFTFFNVFYFPNVFFILKKRWQSSERQANQ